MKHIDSICSLDSKLFFGSICSIGIFSGFEVIAKTSLSKSKIAHHWIFVIFLEMIIIEFVDGSKHDWQLEKEARGRAGLIVESTGH